MSLRLKLLTAPTEPIILNVSMTLIVIGLLSFVDVNFSQTSLAINFAVSFLLYFSAIFSSPFLHLVFVIITITTSLLMHIPHDNIIRAAIFSLALLPISTRFPSFPRFYATATMWLLLGLFLSSQTLFLQKLTFPPAEILFAIAIFEIIMTLLLSILRSQSSLSHLMAAPVQRISVKSYIIQLTSLIVILAFLLSCSLATLLSQSTITDIVIAITKSPLRILIAFVIFVVLPVALSYFFSNPLSRFIDQTKSLLDYKQTLSTNPLASFSVSELNDLQDFLQSTINAYQSQLHSSSIDLNELRSGISQREAIAQYREQVGLNLQYILNKAPYGCIALTSTGHIIECNELFREALNLGAIDIANEHYAIISSDHPWAEEIVGILDWACKEHKSLIGQGSFRFFSSSVDQSYLEIEVFIKGSIEDNLAALSKPQQNDHRKVGAVLFFQLHHDIRDYLATPLTPTRDLIIEKYAVQVCEEIKERLVKITDDTTEQKRLVLSARTPETFDNLRLLTQDIDKLTHESLKSINKIALDPKVTDDYKTINLTNYIQDCLNHLYDMMSLGRRIQLKDGSVLKPSEKSGKLLSAENSPPPPPIYAEASAAKLATFSRYFLSFIKNILPTTTKIDISLATEHIGSGTASILPSTSVGDFARIYIRHAGQSVTPNMTLKTFAEICSTPRPPTNIEVAVALLMWQVKDLGGFVTIQSSVARGTQVTIYLPLNQREHADIERKRSDIRPAEFKIAHHKKEGDLPYVLLISPDTEELATFKRMIIHLGYHVTLDRPEDYLTKDDESIGFGGLGFGDSISVKSDDVEQSRKSANSPFDIVLVNTNKTFPVNIEALKNIEQKTPGAQTIILINNKESIGSEITKYSVLLKPFDLDDLKRVMEEAMTKKLESSPNS